MNETQNNTEMVFYYMVGSKKVWTPNADLAHARAEHYGTNEVFFEKYLVKDIDGNKN